MTTQASRPTTGQTQARIADLTNMSVKPRSLWMDAWSRLIKNKASVVGMVVIVIFTLLALFASVIAPHNPLKINDGQGFLPPVWIEVGPNGKASDPSYLFGTDTLGRDVLSRPLSGARVSLRVGFLPKPFWVTLVLV